MRKLFFLGVCLFSHTHLLTAHPLATTFLSPTIIKASKQFPTVYYNAKKFPAGLFNKKGAVLISKADRATTLIAWDINGVLFKKEYSIPRFMYQLAVTEKYGWIVTFKALASFTNLMRYKKQLKKQHDPRGWVFEAMFQHLEKSPHEKKYVPLLRKFTTQVNRLNYPSVSLLQDLTKKGHTNVLLSNMGQGLVDAIVDSLHTQTQTKPLSPHTRDALNFTINFISNSPHHVIAAAENNWLHKPLRKSYQACIEKNQSHPQQLKILLDDKLSNITAGLRDGLFDIGILFTTAAEVKIILDDFF
jgi:hypothetical protein